MDMHQDVDHCTCEPKTGMQCMNCLNKCIRSLHNQIFDLLGKEKCNKSCKCCDCGDFIECNTPKITSTLHFQKFSKDTMPDSGRKILVLWDSGSGDDDCRLAWVGWVQIFGYGSVLLFNPMRTDKESIVKYGDNDTEHRWAYIDHLWDAFEEKSVVKHAHVEEFGCNACELKPRPDNFERIKQVGTQGVNCQKCLKFIGEFVRHGRQKEKSVHVGGLDIPGNPACGCHECVAIRKEQRSRKEKSKIEDEIKTLLSRPNGAELLAESIPILNDRCDSLEYKDKVGKFYKDNYEAMGGMKDRTGGFWINGHDFSDVNSVVEYLKNQKKEKPILHYLEHPKGRGAFCGDPDVRVKDFVININLVTCPDCKNALYGEAKGKVDPNVVWFEVDTAEDIPECDYKAFAKKKVGNAHRRINNIYKYLGEMNLRICEITEAKDKTTRDDVMRRGFMCNIPNCSECSSSVYGECCRMLLAKTDAAKEVPEQRKDYSRGLYELTNYGDDDENPTHKCFCCGEILPIKKLMSESNGVVNLGGISICKKYPEKNIDFRVPFIGIQPICDECLDKALDVFSDYIHRGVTPK